MSLALFVIFRSTAFCQAVKVEGGLLEGTVEDGLRVYRGIPYAAPPVGNLRWQPPQPAPTWGRVRAADQFGRACIQTNEAIANLQAPSELHHPCARSLSHRTDDRVQENSIVA
jgi:carboxylesterase type B